MNDIIILAMLLEGPKHGYRIKQEAALFSSGQQLHNNTVYPLLNRFLRAGWITRRAVGGERGQTRLLYELTEAGRQALIASLSNFDEADAANQQAFYLRVSLFDLLEPQDRERILRQRDLYLAARQQRVAHIGDGRALEGWPAISFDRVAGEIAGERRWIAELITRIHG